MLSNSTTPNLPHVPIPPHQISYPDAIIGEITPNHQTTRRRDYHPDHPGSSTQHVAPPSASILNSPSADTTHYLVSWRPNPAGIITDKPSLVEKGVLCARFPDIVEQWEEKGRQKIEDGQKMKARAEGLARLMWGGEKNSSAFGRSENSGVLDERAAGVRCTQGDSTTHHWGEVHPCDGHPIDQDEEDICKGCRVDHWSQITFNLQGRGARVAVCAECARRVQNPGGDKPRLAQCVCETKWKCWACRERELNELARARRMWEVRNGGACGRCCGTGEMVDTIGW